jgi:hypothetical protein
MTENAGAADDEENIRPEILNRYCGVVGRVRRPPHATGAGHSDAEIDSDFEGSDSDSESDSRLDSDSGPDHSTE